MDQTTTTDEIRLNFWSPEAGAPDGLYPHERVAETLPGLAALDDDAVARFHQQGYLAIADAFTPQETADAIAGLMDCIAGRKKGFDLNVEAGVQDWDKVSRPEDRLKRVRKLNAFVDAEPRLKHLCWHPSLVSVLTRLLGEPPALYANQALLKPPFIGSEKPWHQDLAYFNVPPEATVVGVWVALDEATPENGCMHLVPGSHRGGPRVHFKVRDWQLCDRDVPLAECVAAPLPPGGILLFHGLLWHGTPPNRSPHTRRALQFHYHGESVQRISAEERLAIYGADGKDAEC